MRNLKKILLAIITYAAAAQGFTATEASLPLEFNTGNPAPYGLPSAFISIHGKTLPIIVDTGSSNAYLMLTRYALGNAPIKYTGHKMCFMAFDGKHCQPEFILSKVTIGNFNLTNVKASIMESLWGGVEEKAFVSTEASRNGLIGLKLLEKFNLLLDFPHNRMILVQPGSKLTAYDTSKWISFPFGENLSTQLKINGKILHLDWDTGSVPSILKRDIAAYFSQKACPLKTSYGAAHCMRVETKTFTTLLNERLPKTWFMVQDIPQSAPFDGLIGSNFFRKNIVYINFDQHRIYVKPRGWFYLNAY